MSEEQKQERTVDQIHREYTQLCSQAGHIQYQIFTLNNDLERINETLRDLNLEAGALNAKLKESSNG